MTETVIFFVPGRPFSKKRPRFGRGRTYTDPETVAAEEAIWFYAKRAMAGHECFEGPVRLTCEFRFERAAHQSKEARASAWHAHPNDLDNLVKLVLDGLNPYPSRAIGLKPRGSVRKGIWLDDGQVASILAEKLWADAEHREGTTVKIEGLS